jgi:single-strand DNA-binding protein
MLHYNHITLVGNLVKDPKLIKVGEKSKASFVLAIKRYTDRDKENMPNFAVDNVNIIAWGNLGKVCVDYLHKGSKVLVDGCLQVRKTSNDKLITEIVAENMKFLSIKKEVNNEKI